MYAIRPLCARWADLQAATLIACSPAGQVPCYTEGEDSLKKTIDSLATLNYDDRRKLLFIICDGMIVGSGNDRPTPRIVLDILGVDQTIEPDPLMYKAVAEGSKQLNYGKVWSGLYEVEGRESSRAQCWALSCSR